MDKQWSIFLKISTITIIFLKNIDRLALFLTNFQDPARRVKLSDSWVFLSSAYNKTTMS